MLAVTLLYLFTLITYYPTVPDKLPSQKPR